jgi:hypothetical protein
MEEGHIKSPQRIKYVDKSYKNSSSYIPLLIFFSVSFFVGRKGEDGTS